MRVALAAGGEPIFPVSIESGLRRSSSGGAAKRETPSSEAGVASGFRGDGGKGGAGASLFAWARKRVSRNEDGGGSRSS